MDNLKSGQTVEFNKIYDLFTGPNAIRKDIEIVKIDGEESSDLSETLGVGIFPTFILMNPYDVTFPQKYTFNRKFDVMKDFLISQPEVVNPKAQTPEKPKSAENTPSDLSALKATTQKVTSP